MMINPTKTMFDDNEFYWCDIFAELLSQHIDITLITIHFFS